ncbi:DUF3396 domain-containing protein [Myxococcaceae bacterium GXIMD 01537]
MTIPSVRIRDERGRVLLRDGLVLMYFMPHSHDEFAKGLSRALELYRRFIPPTALEWYLRPEGEWAPLDEVGWEYVHQDILETPRPVGIDHRLQESVGEVGAYNFEYSGAWLDDAPANGPGETSAACFTLPSEALVEHGPGRIRDLAVAIAAELPLSFGYASGAFVSPGGLRSPVEPELAKLCRRYPGMDVYNVRRTSAGIGTHARGAYWLTFLGEPLLGQLGGAECIRPQLPPSIEFAPAGEGRLVIALGEWPIVAETPESRALEPYRALARVLEPLLGEARTAWLVDEDFQRRWLRRFLPPTTGPTYSRPSR